MSILIIAFLTVVVLWVFYWSIVRQSVLDSVEDDLCRLRNSVEWAIIEGAPASQSKQAQELLEEIGCVPFIYWVSFSYLAWFTWKTRSESKELEARHREAFKACPVWIREARETNARLMVKAAIANSPAWWLLIPGILFVAIFSKQISDWVTAFENSANELHLVRFVPVRLA